MIHFLSFFVIIVVSPAIAQSRRFNPNYFSASENELQSVKGIHRRGIKLIIKGHLWPCMITHRKTFSP